MRKLLASVAVALLLPVCALAQVTALFGNGNITGTFDFQSGSNLDLASGSTMTFGISGTTNSLLYLTNSSGNVGTVGLGAGLSISGGNLVAGSSSSHNPTGTIGLSAVNGSASTFMTSDSAPALGVAIAPTWTGLHNFNETLSKTSGTDYGLEITPTVNQRNATNAYALYINETVTQAGTGSQLLIKSGVGATDYFDVDTSGNITDATWEAGVIGSAYGGAGAVSGVLSANGSGLVSAAIAGTGVQISGQTIQLAPISTGYVVGNTTGTTNLPQGYSLTSMLDTLPSAPNNGYLLQRVSGSWIGESILATPTTQHDVATYSNTTGYFEDLGVMNVTSTQATVTATNNAGNGVLQIVNAYSGSGPTVDLGIFHSGLSAGGETGIAFGVGNGTDNLGSMYFKYVGSGSSSNAIALGFYAVTDAWTLNTQGTVTQKGKIATYNNIATAGNGVASVMSAPRTAANTNALWTPAAYTTPAVDSSYMVSANINVTATTAAAMTCTCTYTDETNTSRVLTLAFTQLSGATLLTSITNVTGTGPYESISYHIRCKASTTITFATAGTVTGITYNAEGSARQIN